MKQINLNLKRKLIILLNIAKYFYKNLKKQISQFKNNKVKTILQIINKLLIVNIKLILKK